MLCLKMGECMVKTESTQVDEIMEYKDINGLKMIMKIAYVITQPYKMFNFLNFSFIFKEDNQCDSMFGIHNLTE